MTLKKLLDLPMHEMVPVTLALNCEKLTSITGLLVITTGLVAGDNWSPASNSASLKCTCKVKVSKVTQGHIMNPSSNHNIP
jgi:hypothetical protein